MRRCALLLVIVLAVSTNALGYYISSVTVSPPSPLSTDNVVVTVLSNAPATNFYIDHVDVQRFGSLFFVDMYWGSTGLGAMVLKPVSYDVTLGVLNAGNYTVYVRSYYEGRMREHRSVSFTVSNPASFTPTWPFVPHYPWLLLRYPSAHMYFFQLRGIQIGGGTLAYDVSLSTRQ